MKRAAVLAFLALTLSSLPACTGLPDCFRVDVFCAGLVTNTSGMRDYGLNQNTWAGMQQAAGHGLADHVAYIESVDARDYGKNIAAFAEDGYDVIVTVGPALDDETLRAADLYPVSVFIGMDQTYEGSRPNLLPVTFPEDRMGFWAGALAARLTKTGVVAGVCETSGIDSMWRYCEGFRNGVEYTDDEVKVLITYRDNESSEKLFIDSEWGKSAAQNMIERGADVIFAAGGGTGQGALLAAAEAGIRAIGAERDQEKALPEVRSALITSVYGRADLEVQEWMRRIREGLITDTAVSGAIGYVPYSEIRMVIPEGIKSEMDRLLLDLSTDKLQTNLPVKRP